jgi:hypothetical protein
MFSGLTRAILNLKRLTKEGVGRNKGIIKNHGLTEYAFGLILRSLSYHLSFIICFYSNFGIVMESQVRLVPSTINFDTYTVIICWHFNQAESLWEAICTLKPQHRYVIYLLGQAGQDLMKFADSVEIDTLS